MTDEIQKELIEKWKKAIFEIKYKASTELGTKTSDEIIDIIFKAGQKEATEDIQQILLVDTTCASGELSHLANDKKLYKYITSFRFKKELIK